MTKSTRAIIVIAATAIAACDGPEVVGVPEANVYGLDSLNAPLTWTADGVSPVEIVATVDSIVPKDKRKVTFTSTTLGFAGAASVSVLADSQRLARAFLNPPSDSTTVRIIATLETGARTVQIVFHRALADRIELSSSAFQIDTGYASAIDITAVLRRNYGSVSPAAHVTWHANIPGTGPIGQFSKPESTTDASGTATVKYTLGVTAYRGPIAISAATAGSDGVEKTAVIFVQTTNKP